MPAKWTGDIVRDMHMHRITNKELAKALGVTEGYVSMVLNGKRSSATAKQRFTEALDALIKEARA